MRSERLKTAFSACLAVFLMCALCAIWHFSACFAAIATCSMSSQCTHACQISAGLYCRLRLAVQRYDTKTILTNFCVKISQWNVFLGRRRCHTCHNRHCFRHRVWPKATLIARRSIRQRFPKFTYLQPYRDAMWHADAQRWPPIPCLHTRHALLSRTEMLPHCEPSALDLKNINV